MNKLTLQRIPFTVDADNRLRSLKARTGITPNILCRMGFCLSLEEPGIPKPIPEKAEMGREINRFTLLGEYDLVYTHLLAAWIQENAPTSLKDGLDDYFVVHMNRGVEVLNARIKGLVDLSKLI